MSEEWHGWTVRGQAFEHGEATLHVGPVPGRKSVCIYVIEGSVMHVVAYCRSEEEGHRLLRFMDRAFASVSGRAA